MRNFLVLPEPRQCILTRQPALKVAWAAQDPVLLSQRLQKGHAEEEFGFFIHEMTVDDFCAKWDIALPDGFTREEGYLLCAADNDVSLGYDTDAGRFYALSTLSQVMATVEGDAVPGFTIIDWPKLAVRGFNMCYHVISERQPSLAPNFPFLLRMVRTYANLKMNAMVIEFEGMFPYQKHPLLHNGEGFTLAQMEELRQVCRECHVEVIPLVQSLGHAYYVLRHPEYAYLRETPRTTQQYCPLNPDAAAFYFELAQEILAVFPDVRRWHMGGDESRRLGVCEKCAEKVKRQGMSHLYADYMNRVAEWFLQRNITPLSWGDIFEEHPETLGVLDKRISICYWNYDIIEWYRSFLMQKIQGAGYRVFGCAAAKFGACSDSFYLYQKSMRNVSIMANEVQRIGAQGTLLTDWPKHSTYEVSVPSNAYSAQISWDGPMAQQAFAASFARVFYGAAMPRLDEAMCHLGEVSFGNMNQKDDIWVAPYSNLQNSQTVDGLDRFDHSRAADAVHDILRENVRQEVSPATVSTLRLVIQRAQEAREILSGYQDAVRWNGDVFAVLMLAADTLECKSRVGLALDEAVKLLKYPVPGEEALRSEAARMLLDVLSLWRQVREETLDILGGSNFPAGLENKLKACFPQEMERYLTAYADCLKSGAQLQGLMDFQAY